MRGSDKGWVYSGRSRGHSLLWFCRVRELGVAGRARGWLGEVGGSGERSGLVGRGQGRQGEVGGGRERSRVSVRGWSGGERSGAVGNRISKINVV